MFELEIQSQPQELREIIEDDDDDFTDIFDNPNELMEIIGGLEETNLSLIMRCQTAEHAVEDKKNAQKNY